MITDRRLLALPALALAGGLLLAGCGDDKKVSIDGTDYSVSEDGDEVKIESSEGSFQGTKDRLPDGFPSDQVPVIDGTIDGGFGADGESGRGYTVVIKADDVSGSYDSAVSRLKDAGFTVKASMDVQGMRTSTLSSPAWNVVVTGDPNQGTVSYVVTQETSSATPSAAQQ